MPIEITEFGDATPGRPAEEIAQLYVRYYQELRGFPYVRSASAFILSSPDPQWAAFAWREEGGGVRPVVEALGGIVGR